MCPGAASAALISSLSSFQTSQGRKPKQPKQPMAFRAIQSRNATGANGRQLLSSRSVEILYILESAEVAFGTGTLSQMSLWTMGEGHTGSWLDRGWGMESNRLPRATSEASDDDSSAKLYLRAAKRKSRYHAGSRLAKLETRL